MLNKDLVFLLPNDISAININNPFQSNNQYENVFDIVKIFLHGRYRSLLKKVQIYQ